MEEKKGKNKKIVLGILLVAVVCLLAAAAGWLWGVMGTSTVSQEESQKNVAVTGDVQTEGTKEALDKNEDVVSDTGKTQAGEETTDLPVQEDEGQMTEKEPSKDSDAEAETETKPQEGLSALHVEGTSLCDESGKLIQLRGISTHGLSWYPEYVNEECFRQLKEEWNINVVRLAMYTAENGGYCTDGNKESLKQLVKDGVEYATENDLYVIVDWHILSDGNPNTYKEEAKSFFDEMSRLYKDYPNVIFEICNEPNGGTSWSDIKSYAEEIIGVIRENGAENVVIVGTPNWSQYVDQAAADPITSYDNIMYALHYYAATHKEDLRQKMVDAYHAGLPVFVSEYGICDASGSGGIDEAQANAWVEEMNKYGISYVAWNLSNKNETSAIFKSSCNKVSGFTQEDLSDSGKWLYKMLTGHEEVELTVTPSATQEASANQESATTQTPVTDSESTVAVGTLEITLELKDSWQSGGKSCFNYSMTVKNTSDNAVDTWKTELAFSDTISLNQGWNGVFTVNGNKLEISCVDYNGRIEAGQSVGDIGFILEGSEGLKLVE